MKLIVIVHLCLLSLCLYGHPSGPSWSPASDQTTPPFDASYFIDSNDVIVFNLDQIAIFGQIVEIPLLIFSDEVINALDFSFSLNTANVEFESVIDHTDGLQYAAFFNPIDLKFRFTSNSFSSYPKYPLKVVSVRFRVLSGALYPTDFLNLAGYLNGDACSFEMQSKSQEIAVSRKEIITDAVIVSPNPASDALYIQGAETGILDVFDMQGHEMMRSIHILPGQVNSIDVSSFSRGQYTLRLQTTDGKVRTQKIILQ